MSDSSSKRGLYFNNVVDEVDSQSIRRKQNNKMIRNTVAGLFLLILVLFLALRGSEIGIGKIGIGSPFENNDTTIDTSRDPLQKDYSGEKFKREISGDEFTIAPLATYDISAILGSTRTYYSASSDPAEKLYAKIAPIDLCLAGGSWQNRIMSGTFLLAIIALVKDFVSLNLKLKCLSMESTLKPIFQITILFLPLKMFIMLSRISKSMKKWH